jgi:hypothetical protein
VFLYHVIVRGNRRRDQSDRVAYLDRIEHYRERYRCIVYRLPVNVQSVHLLIETGGWAFQDHAINPVQWRHARRGFGSDVGKLLVTNQTSNEASFKKLEGTFSAAKERF